MFLLSTLRSRLIAFLQARHRQHWQAGAVGGGGMVQLGFVTKSQALDLLQSIKGDNEPVVYVDTERGFIAYGKHPEAAQ